MTTLSSDPFTILLAHDAWGPRLLLDRARPLSRDQLHRRFEMGPGSLHGTAGGRTFPRARGIRGLLGRLVMW